VRRDHLLILTGGDPLLSGVIGVQKRSGKLGAGLGKGQNTNPGYERCLADPKGNKDQRANQTGGDQRSNAELVEGANRDCGITGFQAPNQRPDDAKDPGFGQSNGGAGRRNGDEQPLESGTDKRRQCAASTAKSESAPYPPARFTQRLATQFRSRT